VDKGLTQENLPPRAKVSCMRIRLFLVLLVLGSLLPTPARAGARWMVYAHRGAAALAPENTLGAFRSTTARFGAAAIGLEMDTQLDASGDLVIIHDDTLNRTTDCSGRVLDATTAHLQACDARKGWPDWPTFEPVPLARDVLVEAKDKNWRLMIELKNIPGEANFDPPGAQAASALIKIVHDTGFDLTHLVVESFFPTSLDYIEVMAPGIATLLLTTSQLPGAPPRVGFTLGENIAYATARGYEICSPDNAAIDIDARLVDAAHALGKQVIPWTIDEPSQMQAMRALGVDGIITNRPDLALG